MTPEPQTLNQVGCAAPPHSKMDQYSPNEPVAYYATIAFNGQNYDHSVFTVVYMPQPNVTSINVQASVASTPRYIEISST